MCQDPGKVFKGKKMAGRMGGTRATTMGCLVWRVDVDRGLVYVKGQVPGHKGNFRGGPGLAEDWGRGERRRGPARADGGAGIGRLSSPASRPRIRLTSPDSRRPRSRRGPRRRKIHGDVENSTEPSGRN